jgi:hypothetical protein
MLAFVSFGDEDLFVPAFGVSVVAYLLTSAILFVLFKWAMVGKMREGTLNRRSWRFNRYHISLNLTMTSFFPFVLAGGPLHNIFLNALGANVDMSAVVHAFGVYEPDLLTIEADCHVDRLATLSPHIMNSTSSISFKHVRLCNGSHVGAWAWLEGGSILPKGTMLGPCSRLGQARIDADYYDCDDNDDMYFLCGVPAVHKVKFDDGKAASRARVRFADKAKTVYNRL